ncbi:acyl-CoA dehydrogenase [Bordetella ansorpii]|uniref:Acyl-CoA dehydrogenase n=1 Tax=Bordetella ansorpii TaxID=288768 RepID=A0A157S8C5_9BORD|nr:acyl-CoA dehydrogenase family protein [Bordetella ansorpii]SAI66645.1 acyl-CoA dehydrogenase [Bordetella ansorpii]
MDLQHTEDRRMLADMLGRFIGEQHDAAARLRIAYSDAGHDPLLWKRFAEQGAIAALFGEAAGGLGGTAFDITVVFEALGRGLVAEPFLGTLMAGSVLAGAGDAHLGVLGRMIAGEEIAVLAHEETGGYAPDHVATRAHAEGREWVLDGGKAMVPCANTAGHFIISASHADAGKDRIQLFLVPRDAAGLTMRDCGSVDGGRVADLTLRGVRVPAASVLGQAGAGAALLEQALGRGVLALCAEAVGIMDVIRDTTLDYLRTRRQFGTVIGQFQALQHRMTELVIEIEQARSAVINAAAAVDDETDRLARERALAAAKYTIGRVGALVAEETIQLHGGIGMTWELPLAHYAKRLVMIDHQLGDEDEHLARYIALGRG